MKVLFNAKIDYLAGSKCHKACITEFKKQLFKLELFMSLNVLNSILVFLKIGLGEGN
jgi:hypothetical protein